jgi:GTPase
LFSGAEERPEGHDAAVIVLAAPGGTPDEADVEELRELVRSAGVEILAELSSSRRDPDPGTFLGSGKLSELADVTHDCGADVVIFGAGLSPSQERNIERELKCRVIDRTRLILDIFAQRARSYEGKLQVELAQLEHMSTRLVRGWTHLERQKGGIGLRGPGEKQLETDRRLLAHRMKQIRARLQDVRKRRALSRRSRKRAATSVVSLVGYTNAGKSTLFNHLTGATVGAEDRLFATLDPTVRRLALPGGTPAVAADTVGFVRRLPHELVAAFEATLEESREANLLLQVLDAADPEREQKRYSVDQVLGSIDADAVPRLQVLNKVDLMDDADALAGRVDRDGQGIALRVWVSAVTGAGLEALTQVISERLGGPICEYLLSIPWCAGGLRGRLYEGVDVVAEPAADESGWKLHIRATQARLEGLLHKLDPQSMVVVEELDGGADPNSGMEESYLTPVLGIQGTGLAQ